MSIARPNPGSRYIVRERLGRGRWKEVYRAVVRGEWHDRALARFIEEPGGTEFFDEIKSLLDSAARGQLDNVARLFKAFKGDDGVLYLEEELLYRPLEALAPLKMVDRFFRIARDLCNGLASLHRLNWVHRDLKLDNCGVDHFGTAKIFDLGSVTSDGASVKGTTLTRAPELFAADPKCTMPSDVWAMGAVLFALRTGGHYPFVTKGEARNRPVDGSPRDAFDKMVQGRASKQNAEDVLRASIKEEFPNGSGQLMSDMLNFDPSNRPNAAECTQRWNALLKPWSPQQAEEIDETEREFQDISAYLNAVLGGSAGMSSLQSERIASAIEKLGPNLDTAKTAMLQELWKKVREMRETVPV